MGFNALNIRGQLFAEANMGETFTYAVQGGVTLTGLLGVFNIVDQEFTFADFSYRKVTTYTCISSCAQWGNNYPSLRCQITDSSGVTYVVDSIKGSNTAGDPAYELGLSKLT